MQDSNGQASEDLLLASMAFFQPVLAPILTSLQPESLCEIGIDKGRFTQHLLAFCKQQGCRYTGIDPSVDGTALADKDTAHGHFIKSRSAEALQDLPPHDLYILDGDHNYHTVRQELRLIFQHAGNRPVLLLHDTAWPFGRRDLYYDPEAIPPGERHPFSSETGPWPRRTGLDTDGFCANEPDTYIAQSEGGPGNGVLTAIEDALQDQTIPEGYHLQTLPVVFGCSILHPAGAIPAEASKKLQQLEQGTALLQPLLEAMETNRMELYLQLLASWKKFDTLHATYGELMGRYEELMDKYGDLHGHADKLLEAYKDLDDYKAGLEARLKNGG